MVTDVTGFCVYSKQSCLWYFLCNGDRCNGVLCLQQAELFVVLPHSGNDKGVSFDSAVELF
jgi:hypothetical protein